jgi:hypothetical protein
LYNQRLAPGATRLRLSFGTSLWHPDDETQTKGLYNIVTLEARTDEPLRKELFFKHFKEVLEEQVKNN